MSWSGMMKLEQNLRVGLGWIGSSKTHWSGQHGGMGRMSFLIWTQALVDRYLRMTGSRTYWWMNPIRRGGETNIPLGVAFHPGRTEPWRPGQDGMLSGTPGIFLAQISSVSGPEKTRILAFFLVTNTGWEAQKWIWEMRRIQECYRMDWCPLF